MRSKAGWVVTLLGFLLALLGLGLMVVLGPDGRFKSGPHPVEVDGIAVVTAPKTLSWTGVQVSVLAELPADKPVFVGLGNAVDVIDYVKGTERLEVTGYETPWTVRTREVKGRDNLPAAPTALDWWLASSAGLGGASIDTSLPDETVSLAILSVGFSNLKGLEVTVAYGIRGAFAKGAGLLLLGLGGLWFGRLLRRDADLWRGPDDEFDESEFEEVVYVYIDEDGVEHEISAEEAEQYEIEDVTVEEFVVDADGDEVGELPEPEPEPDVAPESEPDVAPEPEPDPRPRPGGVLTAGEIAHLEAEPGAVPEPQPEAEAENVLYVYVDEDGVEHEVSADELDDYEFVDDDEEERP